MGNNLNQITSCSKTCDCGNLGNLILKETDDNIIDTEKKKEKHKKYFESKNSFQITKETSSTGQIFSNQIIAYLNDNKSDSKNDNNTSNHNNINTLRSTNVHSHRNNNNSINSTNNNDNNMNIKNNLNLNRNNVTKEIIEDNSSIYDDKQDSFVKMENKKDDRVRKLDKCFAIQISKIEEKTEKSLESGMIKNYSKNNLNLESANMEDFINIFENRNIENEGITIDFESDKVLFKGKLDDKLKINGKGKMYFKDGRIYEGIFINGKLNGEGKYTNSSGDIFEGNFVGGILSGKGKIIKLKENNNNNSRSKSRITFNNKSRNNISNISAEDKNKKKTYVGDIKYFKKEGHGIETCDDYRYEGSFHDDMKNGKGVLQYLNSDDKYEGEFKDDKITGYGYYVWENGHTYKGDFIEGKMDGKGIYKWPDGIEYEGEYKNNIREGKGIFKFKNGIYFDGNFVNGRPDGKGKLVYETEYIDAEYKNGKFVGDLKQTMKELKLSVISKCKSNEI